VVIHYIKVNHISTGLENGIDLCAKAREVG
jgi:hypothetical protein